jgi:hypothetical protein
MADKHHANCQMLNIIDHIVATEGHERTPASSSKRLEGRCRTHLQPPLRAPSTLQLCHALLPALPAFLSHLYNDTTLSLVNLGHFPCNLWSMLAVATYIRASSGWIHARHHRICVLGRRCCYLCRCVALRSWRLMTVSSVAGETSAPCPATPWSHRHFQVLGHRGAAVWLCDRLPPPPGAR